MHETIIIGAGISGLTAALYAQRKRMDFLLIADKFGGQLNTSGDIDNYPGIIKTNGIEFEKTLKEQMEFNKIELKEEKVTKIEHIKDENFKVITNKGEYETKSIVIASGARARKLNVKGEEDYSNKGVTYCAICDGPIFSGKNVIIIGGGNAGMEAADFMLNIANKIYILDMADKPVAHEYLVERIQNHEKVEYINNVTIKEIYGDKFVQGLKYKRDGQEHDLKIGGIIIEIGRVPNTEELKDFVDLDEHGHILIDCSGLTTQKGVFASGDCASGHEYQYCIAAGQGCMALLKAARYLARK